jgi:hypothetical protein
MLPQSLESYGIPVRSELLNTKTALARRIVSICLYVSGLPRPIFLLPCPILVFGSDRPSRLIVDPYAFAGIQA